MATGFDRILEQVGPWGRYQKIRFLLLSLACACPAAFGMASVIFMIMPPLHWCKAPPRMDLPEMLRNLTDTELYKILIPHEVNPWTGHSGPSQCQMRNVSELSTDAATSNVLDSEFNQLDWTFIPFVM